MSRYDRFSHADMPGAEENRRIQAGIDAVMRDVIADRYNPINSLPKAQTVTVANAPRVTTAGEERGWADEKPLASPMPNGSFIESVHGAMIDHHLGPALPALTPIRATIQALTPEQRGALLRSSGLRPELRAMLMEAEAA
jgi:hypothetical protein